MLTPNPPPCTEPVTEAEIEQMRQIYIKRGRDDRRMGLPRVCPFPAGDRWTDAWLEGWDLENVIENRSAA